jgi:peptide/nickel transport system substrate-binding protein
MSRTKPLVVTLVLALLLTGIASCGPAPAAQPTTAGATPAPPTAAQPAPTLPPSPPPAESSITIVVAEDPPSFNGAVTDTGYESLVMKMVLLGMADLDPWGKVVPELAAELPTVENGLVKVDELSGTMDVTWTMRQDVQWADGRPVTADDVVFTWEAITDPETGMWVAGLDYTDSIEKIDSYSFVVHYSSVYPAYLTQFGGENVAIWPAHYCDPSQGFVSWDCNQQPLSDGPFILQEWQHGDHLTLVRNPRYYEPGKPRVDQIIVKVVPEAAVRKTMLLQGDADVIMWLTEAVADELKGAPDVNISFSPTGRWVMRLLPNLAARGTTDPVDTPHPILADVRVRQAIRLAVDVDTISRSVFHGYPTAVWTELFRPPYICDVPRPAHDPQAARDLLAQAGWEDQDGDGIRECHGCLYATEGYRMSLELAIYSEYGTELELAQQLVGEMLKAIGLETQLTQIQSAVMWADYASGGTEQTGNFDLDMLDDGYPGIDPTDHLWFYYDSASAEPDNGWNVMRYRNEQVDALLDEAYTLDEDRRKEVFCEIADILDADVPQILLWTTIEAAAYSARVQGVQASVNDILTWNVADWSVAK